MRSSLCRMSFAAWRRSKMNTTFTINSRNIMLTRVHIHCYSTRRASAPRQRKIEPQQSMEVTGEFYVVRKGDLIGVYKSFSECQKQLSISVCDPAVSVYKGHFLQKDTKAYLASHGLKDAIYTINASDVKDDLFGALTPCPFQDFIGHGPLPADPGHSTLPADPSSEHPNMAKCIENPTLLSDTLSCILEFDGASKGNPGKAGAGAILRSINGTVISRLREGLGVTTNNVAEYRAIILGMKYALKKGFKQIHIQGDSKLICNQVNGVWRTRHQNLVSLHEEAKELKDKFLSITVHHVKRMQKQASLLVSQVARFMRCLVRLTSGNPNRLLKGRNWFSLMLMYPADSSWTDGTCYATPSMIFTGTAPDRHLCCFPCFFS